MDDDASPPARGLNVVLLSGRSAGGWATAALYLAYAAYAGRGLVEYSQGTFLPLAAALLVAFLVLFAGLPRVAPLTVSRPWLLHGYFLLESGIVVALGLLPPSPDFITGLLILLSFRAAHSLSGRSLPVWIVFMCVLVTVPMVLTRGLAWGLALALISMVGCIVVPAYVVVNEQLEVARAESEALLRDLQEVHRQLQAYSVQAAELATIEEHNRLARELHDSVSQTLFSITLGAGAVRVLLGRDPGQARSQLERLQELTQSALADMRGFIAQLRPRESPLPRTGFKGGHSV